MKGHVPVAPKALAVLMNQAPGESIGVSNSYLG